MSNPRKDYDDMLYGIHSELVGVQSSLNMPAERAEPFLGGAFLADTDGNARHAYAHLCAALEMLGMIRGRGGRGIDELLITLRVNLDQPEVRDAMGTSGHKHVMAALSELGERVGSSYARVQPGHTTERRPVLRADRRFGQ